MANATAVFAPGQRLVDESGVPYASATVYFYAAGTTTGKIVYSDAELTTPLGDTIYTDSAGYPVTSYGSTSKTQVYTDSDSYKIKIVDPDGVTVAEHDNCKGAVVASTGSGGTYLTQDAADVRYVRNPNALASVSTLTTGDKIPAYIAASAGNRNIDWSDLTADLLSEWRTAGYIFSSGVRVLMQSTPPVGWTLESGAAYNDVALKFTTTTPTTGGSVAFSSVFASQTFTGTVGNDTPSITKMAAHDHDYGQSNPLNATSGSAPSAAGGGTTYTTSSKGGGTAHNHSLTMNAFNMAVKFATVNIGQKS